MAHNHQSGVEILKARLGVSRNNGRPAVKEFIPFLLLVEPDRSASCFRFPLTTTSFPTQTQHTLHVFISVLMQSVIPSLTTSLMEHIIKCIYPPIIASEIQGRNSCKTAPVPDP